MALFKGADLTLVAYYPAVTATIVGAASKVAGERAVAYVREEIQKGGHNDSGLLSQSIKSRVTYTPLGPEFEVYSDLEYSRWVNDGTGIYGPYGTPIVSPGGGIMRFTPGKKSSGRIGQGRRSKTTSFGGGGTFTGTVYAYSVRGQEGAHFMEKAMSRIRIATFI